MTAQSPRRTLAWAGLGLAVAVFAVGSVGLSLGAEPFLTWRYCFTWWPYILAVESLLALAGGPSDLFEEPGRFLILLPLSLTVWLVFEVLNFRLNNWSYMGLPQDRLWRWLGYAASYATVLPGLFSTGRLLEFLGLYKATAASKPLGNVAALRVPLVVTGLVFLLLPLALPRLFFPLVWLAFIPLLEPLNHAFGDRSLLAGLGVGDRRPLWLLMTAGMVCGLLWEFWNWRAGARWVYHLPMDAGPKLFEMPMGGYLGFPFFAVECFAITAAFFVLKGRLDRLRGSARTLAWLGVCLAAAAFDLAVMAGIDRWTVIG